VHRLGISMRRLSFLCARQAAALCLKCLFALVLFPTLSRAEADEGADLQTLVELNIPAQELPAALDRFSRATGMAVLVDRRLTRARRSLELTGSYRIRDALTRMLTGTGLMVRYVRANAFTVQVAEAEDSGAGAARTGTTSFNGSYAWAVQQAVEHSLCATPLTRPGAYRALLQVWIGAQGQVQYNRLVASTGDFQRDAALVERLSQAKVKRPPPSSLSQPVTLLLLPDTTGKRMDCTAQQGVRGA
jgi:hypothetical protein